MKRVLFVLLVIALMLALVPQPVQAKPTQGTNVAVYFDDFQGRVFDFCINQDACVYWRQFQVVNVMRTAPNQPPWGIDIASCALFMFYPYGCHISTLTPYEVRQETWEQFYMQWQPNEHRILLVSTSPYFKMIGTNPFSLPQGWRARVQVGPFYTPLVDPNNIYPAPMMGGKAAPTETPAAKAKKTKVPAYP